MTARPLPALPSPATASADTDTVLLDHGLRAQGRLLPYVFGFFGLGLPAFVWMARLSVPTPWLAGYLLLFVFDWTVFMVIKSRADRGLTDPSLPAIFRRQRLQGLAGALWALSLLLISLSAAAAGPVAEPLVMVCAGAAVGIIFFASPVLLQLLTLGPIAAAGPILASQVMRPGADFDQFITGGLALALAMGFVLNRHMREHYRLQHRQMVLADERETARAETSTEIEARIALMETLQREIQTGLKGIEHQLVQGLTLLTRAPAPRAHVDAALKEVSHLQSILTTTFDNDTAAAGEMAVSRQPLDIELIASHTADRFAALAQAKGLSFGITSQTLPDQGAAMGDAARVDQVLSHLVGNALLYTQTGRVDIRLSMSTPDTLRIEVVDSGPGLDDYELEQAFLPHARIQRTSSGHSGAGLGLSLSRSLAELMGGAIGAQSTPDVGSKFWLDLPFDTKAVAPPRPVVEAPVSDDTPAHSLRVLLLSNDSLRAAQLRDQLEGLGHKCLTSTSRERALLLAKKAPVDACLISTGPFEDLHDDGNRQELETFLGALRATQSATNLAILALLPEGDQIDDLATLGVKPLLLPQNRDSLGRALASA